jgi:hypothetical protein
MVEGLTTLLLIGVAVQQSLFRRRLPAPQPRG